MEVFEAAVQHANAGTGDESAEASLTAPTPGGPVVYLDPPGDTESQTRAWLDAFAAHLEAAGISGKIDLAPQDRGPEWYYALRTRWVPTAFHAYTLSTPYPAGTPKPWTPRRGVDADVTTDLCGRAVDWCSVVPGREVYLAQGLSSVRVASNDTPSILVSTMRGDSPGSVAVTHLHEQPPTVRRVHLTFWGDVTFQIDGRPEDWRTRLTALTETLVLRPADLDLAIVRLNLNDALGWESLSRRYPRLPYVDYIDVVLNRHLWDRYTPDAHGLQVLTGRHLEKARDLSGWSVEEIAPDRYLVQAPDLAPWYSGAEPAGDLLAAARHDFGGMILTPQALAAENL